VTSTDVQHITKDMQMNSKATMATLTALLSVIAGLAQAGDMTTRLTGAQETPAVVTVAQGESTIRVSADQSVHGSVKTTGVAGTMAHIHQGAKGTNGPPIITLVRTSETEWSVPPGTVLTDEQFAAYKAGALYINVHSDAHQAGEIRGQLTP